MMPSILPDNVDNASLQQGIVAPTPVDNTCGPSGSFSENPAQLYGPNGNEMGPTPMQDDLFNRNVDQTGAPLARMSANESLQNANIENASWDPVSLLPNSELCQNNMISPGKSFEELSQFVNLDLLGTRSASNYFRDPVTINRFNYQGIYSVQPQLLPERPPTPIVFNMSTVQAADIAQNQGLINAAF